MVFYMDVQGRDEAKDGCDADPGRVKLLWWFKDGRIIEGSIIHGYTKRGSSNGEC